eukprot:gene12473-14633_t
MRVLHTMLRVGDMDKSIHFYTEIMGMKLLRKSENTEYKYTLAFVGYCDESEGAVIELTYNWGVSSYEIGTAFGHIALGVDDVAATVENIRKAGGKITREAGPVKGGKTVIAFAEDPDGYKIELIQDNQAQHGLGCGCIGLSAGVLLLQTAKYNVSIWARDLPPNTTSNKAAALWYPFLSNPPDKVGKWSQETMQYFKDHILKDSSSGTLVKKVNEFFRHPKKEDPDWRKN